MARAFVSGINHMAGGIIKEPLQEAADDGRPQKRHSHPNCTSFSQIGGYTPLNLLLLPRSEYDKLSLPMFRSLGVNRCQHRLHKALPIYTDTRSSFAIEKTAYDKLSLPIFHSLALMISACHCITAIERGWPGRPSAAARHELLLHGWHHQGISSGGRRTTGDLGSGTTSFNVSYS